MVLQNRTVRMKLVHIRILLCNALSALLQITAYDYPFDIFQIVYAILLYIPFV
jgi:hypothetical protein